MLYVLWQGSSASACPDVSSKCSALVSICCNTHLLPCCDTACHALQAKQAAEDAAAAAAADAANARANVKAAQQSMEKQTSCTAAEKKQLEEELSELKQVVDAAAAIKPDHTPFFLWCRLVFEMCAVGITLSVCSDIYVMVYSTDLGW